MNVAIRTEVNKLPLILDINNFVFSNPFKILYYHSYKNVFCLLQNFILEVSLYKEAYDINGIFEYSDGLFSIFTNASKRVDRQTEMKPATCSGTSVLYLHQTMYQTDTEENM